MKLSAHLNFFKFLSPLLLCTTGLGGCASEASEVDEVESSSDDITAVTQSVVERQSIGNCWIYAYASWIESMNKSATGQTYDSSQSYQTYWHWFEQLVNGEAENATEIETGGWFRTSNYLAQRYGIAPESSFIPADVGTEMSARQSAALDRLNQEMKSGRLTTNASRRNRSLVRRVLDDAFQLSPQVRETLTKVFGATARRNLTSVSSTTGLPTAKTAGTFIVRPTEFAVQYTRWDAVQQKAVVVNGTLDLAIKDWRSTPYRASNGRDTQVRIQRALHDSQPVVVSWFVDFNALSNFDQPGAPQGSFTKVLLDRSKPGRQGGHMTVFHDYEIRLPSGEVLPAGARLNPAISAEKAKLDAALSPSAQILKMRIKNSWGTSREDRGFVRGLGGYHDLYMDYLNGPVKQCTEHENAKPLAERGCDWDVTPLKEVILPPGY